MLAAQRGGVPEKLIRAMVERGRSFDYINSESFGVHTAAIHASIFDQAANLDLLLTLGADPKRCREYALRLFYSACRTVLDRFEQRTTLACCLRHYDDLHVTHAIIIPHHAIGGILEHIRNVRDLYPELIPACSAVIRSLELHPDIAALSPFAKILHDLHGINGESHDLSRMILSYI
jgi:hypothetical protein